MVGDELKGQAPISLLSFLQSTSLITYSRMVSLQLSYTLNPPAGTPAPSLPPHAEHEYPLNDATPQQQLISLEAALGQARDTLNEELTAWKEAVKGLEVEQKKKKKSSEEEDEGEEDEEE